MLHAPFVPRPPVSLVLCLSSQSVQDPGPPSLRLAQTPSAWTESYDCLDLRSTGHSGKEGHAESDVSETQVHRGLAAWQRESESGRERGQCIRFAMPTELLVTVQSRGEGGVPRTYYVPPSRPHACIGLFCLFSQEEAPMFNSTQASCCARTSHARHPSDTRSL
jgi:hypothetical protein